jgi:threonine dehydratase
MDKLRPDLVKVYEEVLQAEDRIRPFIRQTYLEPSPYFSQITGAKVYFKCENLQHTGSFKVRGAMNKLLSLNEYERNKGVVTASTGNHGAAVAFALNKVKAQGTVFVPQQSDTSKVANIERLGAEVRKFGSDSVQAEVHAREYAQSHGSPFISPYNDLQIVGGQGTIGLELDRQLAHIDAVFVALGGGGLIAGIAGYLKRTRPGVQLIGCSPEHSQVMIRSIHAGKILDLPSQPTLSDGTAGGVEADSITFPLCQELVDAYETVSEEEIAESLRQFLRSQHQLIEGAAAVPIAALKKRMAEFSGQTVVVVLCGANINPTILKEIL